MSGTLVGKSALVDLLGIPPKRAVGLGLDTYESPFDPARQPVGVISAASSRFKDRIDPDRMARMASAVEQAAIANFPNSLAVYYPSYEYLQMVRERLRLLGFRHESEMRGESHTSMEEKKKRIEKMAAEGAPVLFHGVIGGSYHEGVDFKENPFKLIIVAGFPFPKPTASQIAYERYLAEKFGSKAKAEECASLLPAIVKTVQAMGRGIRKKEDWCYSLLIDDRFIEYLQFFPKPIRDRLLALDESGAEIEIREFSKRMKKGAQKGKADE
jgi:DNA excision repair protein ERCC-2